MADQPPSKSPVQTIVVDNFDGSMISVVNGPLNSGRANVIASAGYNPFGRPGQLTWSQAAVQIDPTRAVITDLIVCGKSRYESGIVYVYAVGHTGRVYKIQVNNPATYSPDYDNPVLLTTITINSPTFTMGGFIDFFDATKRIYIGHDKGVTRLNFDGTGETFMGVLGSWTQSVPRPLKQFVGSLWIGNGNNIAQIDSTSSVVTYTKLSPALPSDYQVRNLTASFDGTYLELISTNLPLADVTATSPNTSLLEGGDSILAKWNGSDQGITSFNFYPNIVLASNSVLGSQELVFGYDPFGGAVYNPNDKLLSSLSVSAYTESPLPTAVSAYGGMITWLTTFYFGGFLLGLLTMFGNLESFDLNTGWWSPLVFGATSPETDVVRVPCQVLVSNFAQGISTNGYPQNLMGNSKIYYSTIESSSGGAKYKLYKWVPSPTSLGSTGGFQTYQTQTQIFPKKVAVKEVRVYGAPWVTGNSFTIDLIGSDALAIPGASKTFTAGGNLTVGQDFAWYNPQHKPTYAIALSITNKGAVNNSIDKVEIDWVEAGK